ncbi:MAG: bifunctional 5,10-methylenetetrahydrofolate dehydrogenase/5,10-methenyltetrahydrofolate cyclohydrolase [Candidatus Eremiobacteraeota bacterium]|nr:bifunctional 5,10-methylenetetrahydrofolate dehydrogenase/5,10-methenyltetrahydrofolate cyclohydrolase [Candidatus Eremiobacteraeota bacterium]
MSQAQVLDGRAIAKAVREEVKGRVDRLRERNVIPRCAIVLLEGDEPGRLYAEQIAKSAAPLGVQIDIRQLPSEASTNDVVVAVAEAVDDKQIQAIMVQRPLPAHLDAERIAEEIDPRKDVDGAHPYNQGLLVAGETFFVPATAAAVMELLRQPQVGPLDGARAVVLGRSAVVGRPVALLLTAADATVTICHSHTKGLPAIAREGEILVAAVGHPRFVTAEMVKPGATVIDVGTNFIDGHFVGDVDHDAVAAIARLLTPVPGGVGPVTTAVLLRSVVEAAERSR